MNDKPSLFPNEDEILQNATSTLRQYQEESDVPIQIYKQLVNDYKKLLKQTKMLVKINDKQQHHLTDRAEEATRVSERRISQFLDAVPVGIFVIDALGRPCYANQKAQKILGRGIVSSQPLHQLGEVYRTYLAGTETIYPYKNQPIICALTGRTVTVDDMEIHRGGKIIPLEVWGTPIFDENDRVSYAIAAFHDITERKQAEANRIQLLQEKEAKNAELVKLNQEKNEFLGIVAHDLKNPLSAILGIAEMIQESIELITSEEVVEYSSIIQKSARMMFQLITNLLDVNAIESNGVNFYLEKVNLFPVIAYIIQDYKERARIKNITIQFQSIEGKYIAFIDQNITRQILDNLISNAVKYSPCGKNVYVRICHYNDFIRCEVEDEGVGLSEADQKKLFGKFTRLTTKPTGGEHSTGLGLFIVKKLVEAMQGKVWCESELDRGAKFIVELPT